MKPLTMTDEREAQVRGWFNEASSEAGRDLLRELDATRERLAEATEALEVTCSERYRLRQALRNISLNISGFMAVADAALCNEEPIATPAPPLAAEPPPAPTKPCGDFEDGYKVVSGREWAAIEKALRTARDYLVCMIGYSDLKPHAGTSHWGMEACRAFRELESLRAQGKEPASNA